MVRRRVRPAGNRRWVRAWIMLVVGSACLAAGPGGCAKSAGRARSKPDAPNIILLTIESLRSDHIGCYGYERATTPHIDGVASEGTVYDNAFSVTSWTLASHASIFTGLYPSAHRVIEPRDRLSDSYTTLAERLKACGYQTAAAVSGTYLQPPHNLNQGFEIYDTTPVRKPKTPATKDITNPRMQTAMFRFLTQRRDPDRPFFLFGYYWDPHHHYIPPPPYDSMFVPPGAQKPKRIRFDPLFRLGRDINNKELEYLIAQYDGEIRWTDDHLGRLWALLKELGLWDHTAIIITADHAEEFYEHGRNSHKNSVYTESIHVPLIIKLAHQSQSGRDARVVSLIDLYPTVLDIAGCPAGDAVYSGQSLLGDPVAGRPVFFELRSIWSYRNKRTHKKWNDVEDWEAVRDGPYKLVHVVNKSRGTKASPRWELYDLRTDPAEKNPLIANLKHPGKYAEVVGALQGKIERWHKNMQSLRKLWSPSEQAQLSADEEQRLRSLGYLP